MSNASSRPPGSHGRQSGADVVVIAGATGALGNEVLRRLAGLQRHAAIHVLAREPMRPTFRGVHMADAAEAPGVWPVLAAAVGLILFEPPRLYHDRERALWTPQPVDLPATARWMHGCGVRSLAVVMPHDQGRLPAALRQGLANLDEQAVAAIGFERLLIVRSARVPAREQGLSAPRRLARWLLGSLSYLVPSTERPVRARVVAEFVEHTLRELRARDLRGTWVASPQTLWRAAQVGSRAAVAEWLTTGTPG